MRPTLYKNHTGSMCPSLSSKQLRYPLFCTSKNPQQLALTQLSNMLISPLFRPVSQSALYENSSLSSVFGIKGAKNVVLDTVKRAEDSDHIILRLHEAFGGRARFKVTR